MGEQVRRRHADAEVTLGERGAEALDDASRSADGVP